MYYAKQQVNSSIHYLLFTYNLCEGTQECANTFVLQTLHVRIVIYESVAEYRIP